MVSEKLLNRNDPTGKRGSKVYFSLTEKGKRKYDLKILGPSIEVQRRKKLYSLLIFFEIYKRGSLLTERQLSRVLEAIGSSINDFKKSPELTQACSIPGTFRKSIKGVEILGISSDEPRTKSSNRWYYTAIPGFSVEEFISYQKTLKSGREPRPYLSSRTIIPFALSESYTKKEVEEAVASFKESGLLEPIEPVFPGDTRYNIADRSLRALVRALWLVSMLDFELLCRRLLFSKPDRTDRDKKYLEICVGQDFADKIIAGAYHYRKSKNKEEHTEEKKAIEGIEAHRRSVVQRIISRFAKVIQENEIVYDIVEEICFSPLTV